MTYGVLAVLWLLWCALHSGMITQRVTNALKSRPGDVYRYYRLVYNVVAIVTLIPLLIYSNSLKAPLLYEWHGLLLWIKTAMLAVSIGLFVAGALKYDLLSFAGIRQLRTGKPGVIMSESGAIDDSGILGWIRHPWYLAAILFVWSDDVRIDTSTLMVNTILTLYVLCGTILEERKLVAELGDAYRTYQQRVPMLVPIRWRRTRTE